MSLARVMQLDADMPGGNICLERIDGDTVYLHPDLRDTAGNWFYWCFRVQGATSRTVRFVFTAQEPLAARGPALSRDQGITWQWLGKDPDGRKAFTYRFGAEENDLCFSMGMPYTQAHWERMVAAFRGRQGVELGVLCRSRKGRAVEMLRVGRSNRRLRVLVTARHHACEMMASYAVEGIIQAALADDQVGRWWGEHVELLLVPFVDKDGVEDGDQGKNRQPHDHNRDYGPQSIYPETRALQDLAAGWVGTAPMLLLDMHCPWIYGGINELIYQPGVEESHGWEQQQAFARALRASLRGPLPYDPANDLPFGRDWNTRANYGNQLSCHQWAMSLPAVTLATVLELPYAQAGGVEVNAQTARAFGQDVGRALMVYGVVCGPRH